MRVDVVQERAMRHQPGRDCEPAAKRFHQTSVSVRLPKWFEVRELPTLPAGPFERRPNSIRRPLRRNEGRQGGGRCGHRHHTSTRYCGPGSLGTKTKGSVRILASLATSVGAVKGRLA